MWHLAILPLLTYVRANTCSDDLTWKDNYGDSCEWYSAEPDNCGRYGAGAWNACCACGGSSNDNVSIVNVSQFAGSYVNAYYVGKKAIWPEYVTGHHYVTISQNEIGPGLYWSNEDGIKWTLGYEKDEGAEYLRTNDDCPFGA